MAAPMRILQVLRTPVGGLFRHVVDLTTALAARGHLVGVVADSLVEDSQSEGRLRGLASHAALGIHRMPIPRLLGLSDLTAPFKIRALAQKLDVQILHGHGAKGGFHARLARLGDRRRVALYTPHGGVLHFPPRSPAGVVFRGLERLLLAQTDAMVFESAFARDAFASQIVVPTCPAPVIHNGLAPAEFEPVTPDPDAADFVFVGELRELKGIFVLIEALSLLGGEATLVMAGDGVDRQRLTARIADLGLAHRVALVGVQPARRMFARGRVVVVPSLAESLPYVVLEAAAAGRPVIATRVGGIAEIFGPTAASLVEGGSVPALRAAMERVLGAPGEAESEAEQRLDHIAPRFSIAAMTDQIERLYGKLLG
jgi:glycosyltransferase involved in cell wall biosynthesis